LHFIRFLTILRVDFAIEKRSEAHQGGIDIGSITVGLAEAIAV